MSLSSGNQPLGLVSREDMLRELELLPVWRLRQPLSALEKTQAQLETANEPALTLPEPPDYEQPAIEVLETEHSAIQSMTSESAEAAAVAEVSIPPQADSTEQAAAPAFETAFPAAGAQDAPLRFLLCENSHYGFLMAPDAAGADVAAVETLFKNMLRAMQVSAHFYVADTVANIFATHTPKILLSLGSTPANQLLGKSYTVDEWRSLQQQSSLLYAEIPLIVTYHPAHLLEHTADKAPAWRDLCAAMKLMQRL